MLTNKNIPVKSISDEDWFEGESIRAYMSTQQQTLIITLIAIPLIFLVLLGHVNLPGLLVWLTLSGLINIYRLRFTRHFAMHFSTSDAYTLIQFKAKYAWVYPFSSAIWGALVWLFYTKAPLFNQFICWTTLASIGSFGIFGYAPNLKIAKQFVNSMTAVMVAGIAWHYFLNNDDATKAMTYSILPLLILFWFLLILTGTRLNKSHLQGLELRKGNLDLIESLQEQTSRANQAVETKNRFLASAAHDIRQPVLALDVYASMLRAEPEMAGVLTEKIELATKSVIEMFDSLFDLSRLDAGQLKISNSAIDVLALMQELELQHTPAAHKKRLELRMRSGHFTIHTDPQLLKRILGNLLMNAIKFTNKGGVLLACRQTLKGIRFEVWDTGVGIAADEQAAVFGEFYKSSSHLGTSEGFGLGLSIVSRLCEPLGFKFSMQSRLGRGSVFVVEVPTAAHQQLTA
jgi:signal transduction histidine kinase